MYDFKLKNNEEIRLISDDTIIYTDNEEINVTCIITNQRLLILDYPSGIYNSAEDLRVSGKMTYIRKKEIVAEINLKDITSIIKENNYYRIELNNKSYINLSDEETISSAFTTLETDSLIKDDYYDILNFLKRPTFIQMVEKLNSVKKAVILALRYGYIDDKYYSKSAIAEFLNIDLEEISQAEEDALLLHKENINSYFDKVIDTVTGSRNKK